MPEPKAEFTRLPKSVVPTHYNISLTPNLKTFVFTGKESVQLKLHQPTNEIVCNALELEILNSEYITSNGHSMKPNQVALSSDMETATFQFTETLPVGSGVLNVDFKGTLNDKMKGFYRSKYTSPEGEERYAGVTQFEATDARRCFPCWDEPAIKATFDISLVVPKTKVALSNMPVKTETEDVEDSSRRIVNFETTPIMSTYLVAVAVGEYDYVETKSDDGVLVRVYTPVGKKEQGEFALEVARKVLPYYKEYFQIAYPLPKIDLIAIADFASGAMENWGLVTYRETCLLVDPKNTSAARKQWIALVVGHELAHQWFGNLVTMEWWTHLWLNEGYASFVEFLCVDHLFPEYDIWTQFVTDNYIRALELDSLRNSHPIEVPVGHPSEIDEIFDDISYSKGASVIRMLHRYIGDKDFRRGMNMYLTKHQYGNTFTEDLWAALEEASKKPVGAVMSTWTKQMGYPLISVESKYENNVRHLRLSQQQFLADGTASDPKIKWLVPVTCSTAKAPESIVHETVLDSMSTDVQISNVREDEWVKVNPGTVGFFRVQYPLDMLEQFLPAIQNRTLPPLDRLGLLDDTFALVKAGHTSTVDVLQLMEAYKKEDNYTVWDSISRCLGRLSQVLAYSDCHKEFQAYGRALLSDVAQRLGWEPQPGEGHLNTLLRSLVLSRLGGFADEATTAEAKRRFELHLTGKEIIPADLRAPVYRAVLTVGDEKTYEAMLKLYREADLHEEKDRISRALGAINNVNVLGQILQFAMSDEVRSQDSVFVIISVAMTRQGRDLAWQFFKDHWQVLMNRYEGGFLITRLVKCITENFATEEMAQDVEQFFKEHPFAGTERTVQQSLETIRLNASWLRRDAASAKGYLASYQ